MIHFRLNLEHARLFEKHLNPITKQYELKYDPKLIEESHRAWTEITSLPFFAMRKGPLAVGGWKISNRNTRKTYSKLENRQALDADDICPNMRQKQVDMKLGMDVAHLALKRLVDQIIIVAGDADIAPAAKLARVEGIQVFLDAMNHKSVRVELKNHVDVML